MHADIKGKTCIHSYGTLDQCGRPAFNRKTNGWLCVMHYRQQQESIPAKPRLPQPAVYNGHALFKNFIKVQPDHEVIADIIASDKRAIASGRVVTVQRGATDPVYLRLLEPLTVN